jgi:hypothetical protein
MDIAGKPSSDEAAALAQEVMHVTTVANAVMAAMKFDGPQIARGLIVIITAMVGDDPEARTTVGLEMIRTALEMDPDLISVRWQ